MLRVTTQGTYVVWFHTLPHIAPAHSCCTGPWSSQYSSALESARDNASFRTSFWKLDDLERPGCSHEASLLHSQLRCVASVVRCSSSWRDLRHARTCLVYVLRAVYTCARAGARLKHASECQHLVALGACNIKSTWRQSWRLRNGRNIMLLW